MVIYEVNLTVNNDIFHEFYAWLVKHAEEILRFTGFQQAEIAKEKMNVSEAVKLTVRYTLSSEDDLNHYLTHHAPAMREDGIKRFGNQFSAVRRIFTESSVITLR